MGRDSCLTVSSVNFQSHQPSTASGDSGRSGLQESEILWRASKSVSSRSDTAGVSWAAIIRCFQKEGSFRSPHLPNLLKENTRYTFDRTRAGSSPRKTEAGAGRAAG